MVTITGILATLATYSVRERTAEAHSIEAIAMLGNIRTGILANADDLSGNSGSVLQIGGRVGGFGGPLGLPGVLGKNGNNGNGNGNGNSGNNGNGNGNGNNGGGIDGDGNNGHGNNPDGCDPDNPGKGGKKCGGDTSDDGNGNSGNSGDDNSGNGNGNNGGGNSGNNGNGNGDNGGGNSGNNGNNGGGNSGNNGNSGGDDGDGNNGHGNNADGCDPDNPGNGGKNCGGDPPGDTEIQANHSVCSSADPVPASLDAVKGGLYQSRPSEWSGTRTGGWRCLSISMSGAQRFQYGYDVGSTAVPGVSAPAGAEETFAAWARGDLDGDGRNSWFVLSGAVEDGRVTTAPAITIVDQGE